MKQSDVILQALENAEKNGNTADLPKLAELYVQQIEAERQTQQAQPQERNTLEEVGRQLGLTGRYAINTLNNLGGILYNPLAATANLFLPEGKKLTEADGNPIGDMLGLPRPQGDFEKAVGKATEGAGEAFATGGVGFLRKGVQELTERASKEVAEAVPATFAQRVKAKVSEKADQLDKGFAQASTDRLGTQAAASASASGAIEASQNAGVSDGASLVTGLVAALATPAGVSKLGRKFMEVDNAVSEAGSDILRTARGQNTAPVESIEAKIERTVRGLVADSGFAWKDLDPALQASLRNEVAKALKVNGLVSEDALDRVATIRLAGGTPTRAQATLNPADVSRERNAAKQGINSNDDNAKRLGELENENTEQYIRNLEEMGGRTVEPWQAGEELSELTKVFFDDTKSRLNGLYRQAEQAGGRGALFDNAWFNKEVNKRLEDSRAMRFLPEWVKSDLNQIATGELPLNVDTWDNIKTYLGGVIAGQDGNASKAAKIVRDTLDDTPFRLGEEAGNEALDAANRARKEFRAFKQEVENNKLLRDMEKASETGTTIDPERFVDKYLIKSTARELEGYLKVLGQGAKQTVKDQIMRYVLQKAVGGRNEKGLANLSSKALNDALEKEIGTKKLEMLFEPDELAKLTATRKAANYLQIQPKGSAVNNSNTASTAINTLLEMIAKNSLLGKIPLGQAIVQEPIQNIVTGRVAKEALDTTGGIVRPKVPDVAPLPYQVPGLLPLFLGDDF